MLNSSLFHVSTHYPLRRNHLFAALFLMVQLLFISPACAANVLIIGETQYAMVADVAAEIQALLRTQSKEYAISEIRGKLASVVEREDAQVVVALGMEAVNEALRLPPSIDVVYGLVVAPVRSSRTNVTGVYMSPPVSEYLAAIRRYFPALNKVSVVGSQSMMKSLFTGDTSHATPHHVSSSNDLVTTVNRLGNARALLLLPDSNLLTGPVMAQVFLHSFSRNIPLLGISEASVKQGALFAYVFDAKGVSRQIGEKVQSILNGVDSDEIPVSAPNRYNLFINGNTAQKMGIEIPGEMLRKAKKIY